LRAQPPAEPAKQAPLTPEQRQQRIREQRQFAAEANKLYAAGKLAEAAATIDKLLPILREAAGGADTTTAAWLEFLARVQEQREDFAASRKARVELLAIRTKLDGEGHWRVTNARLALAHVDRLAGMSAEERRRLAEAASLTRQVARLYGQGKAAEAIPLARQLVESRKALLGEQHPDYATDLNNLARLYQLIGDRRKALPLCHQARDIYKKALGEAHPLYALSLNNLAGLYQAMGDSGKALPLYRQALEIRKQTLGEQHPDYAASLTSLASLYQAMGDYSQALPLCRQALEIRKQVLGEAHPLYALSLNNLAALSKAMGDYGKALPLYQQALQIRKQALGEQHPDYATALHNLAALYDSMGDYGKALPLCRQALEIRKQALGEQHPDYAASLNNLALLYQAVGDYAQALPLCRQALEIRKQVLGEAHPLYALSLSNLAGLYREMGDYSKALPLYRQARGIYKKALGEQHPDYATTLNNLALLYQSMGDYGGALPLYRQALDIHKRALGEEHPNYATDLNNLAGLYQSMGDYSKALPLYQQALQIIKRALGEQHPAYAQSLNNLAWLYRAMGDYGKALPLYQQALQIRKQALGEHHPDYATGLNNLAALYDSMEDYSQALPLYRQALEIRKQALGEQHPAYAVSLNNLAALYEEMGDFAQAEPLQRRGLQIECSNLELAAAAQSERQQLAMARYLRVTLDGYLSLAPRAGQPADRAYRHVLAWKGTVLLRQRRLHLQRQRPELVADFAKLDSTAGRLAALALAVPGPGQRDAYRRQIQELSEEKERLEADLADRSAAFRQQRELARLTPRQLQEALPPDTALVDFLEYTRFSPPAAGKGPWQRERRLAAFVVRPDSVVQRDLGPAQPIADAVGQWRLTLKRRAPAEGDADPATKLWRLVWEPLEPHLRGAKIVLVSPDGALTRLPFAALPGADPEKYLIEEVGIAVVPVPQFLPELLAPSDKDKAPPGPALLLVGDVDFGATPGLADAGGTSRSAARAGRAGALPAYPNLPATREEVVAVRDSFEESHADARVKLLRRGQATEGAVRRLAPGYRYLHFAVHGFFAPPELRSALAPAAERPGGPAASGGDPFGRQGVSGFHPGLLSGLVLAGANGPAREGEDDGILTALEVAELDLRGVDLAVLSACETGLGEEAGGEGLLGLQRAFQVAGARSVVASLWKVDDDATRKLMTRFYENLWRPKQPVGKLEALRQAQLWMLHEGVRRGLVLLDEEDKAKKPARTPPAYWAAFTLSGDWR
jgi:tetratricopeptide (TPR) repeat protein